VCIQILGKFSILLNEFCWGQSTMAPIGREWAMAASLSGVPLSELGGHAPGQAAAVTTSLAYGAKLVMDRVLAFVLLIALLPLMAAIALIIRLETPGPSLFVQQRVGFRQNIFGCYKFRSMFQHVQAENDIRQATRGDARMTRVGRFLRRSSLDELPQLLNVLKGEMSLVGPRPHAPGTCAAGRPFAQVVPFYDRRHAVYPGITGWAQVNGWRGETRRAEDIEERVRYDLEYIYNWSLLFDVRIIGLTLVRIFADDMAV